MDFTQYLLNIADENVPCYSVVIGNEACDLDSVVSSLIYAYYLTLTVTHTLPVICVPKEDLSLRTEISYFLSRHGINHQKLIYLDSNRFLKLRNNIMIKVFLVDHNRFNNPLNFKLFKLVDIIDHHIDEGTVVDGVKSIRMVGSCCTLITEILKKHVESVENPKFGFTPMMKELLAGTILLDTINLDFQKGRTTSDDVKMVEYLAVENGDELYNALITAKTNISNLSAYDLLRRDSKNFNALETSVYISSITGADWEMLSKLDILNDVKKYVLNKNIDVLVIGLAHHTDDGKFKRFFIVAHGSEYLTSLPECIQDFVNKLNLVKVLDIPEPFDKWLVFEQLDIKSSRKVFLPLLKSWMTKIQTINKDEF